MTNEVYAMGIGYNFRCESCGHTDRFFIGIGFAAEQVHQETLEKIRAGEYGARWQELLAQNPQADVDTSYCMLYCDDCHLLERGMDLTMRLSDDAECEKETVPYPHLCPQCRKRMEVLCHMSPDGWYRCPECGGKMRRGSMLMWD